jgi:regulator of sirC expression with transglutaminase-like and TPR domain
MRKQPLIKSIRQYAKLRGFNRLADHVSWAEHMIENQIKQLNELFERELTFKKECPVHLATTEPWAKKVYKRRLIGPVRLGDELKNLTYL